MTFVDTNVFMYAVGGRHPLRAQARDFFAEALQSSRPLVVSAEVLQELIHAYLPVNRLRTLDAALALLTRSTVEVWPVEEADARLARDLVREHPGLGARDLIHVASCLRRNVLDVMTFDRALAAVFEA